MHTCVGASVAVAACAVAWTPECPGSAAQALYVLGLSARFKGWRLARAYWPGPTRSPCSRACTVAGGFSSPRLASGADGGQRLQPAAGWCGGAACDAFRTSSSFAPRRLCMLDAELELV